MSALSAFLKKNKKARSNTKYAATKSLVDEAGKPLDWEVKPISTREDEEIRDDCTKEVPITGKPGMYRQKLDTSAYLSKILVASVVEPNLYSAELQDSYGVKTPEELVKEMVDDPGEYQDFVLFVQKYNGFTESLEDKVEEAKKLIEAGDADANYAHYCLQKLHMLPGEYLELDAEEKAFIIASIQIRIAAEKREAAKLKQ